MRILTTLILFLSAPFANAVTPVIDLDLFYFTDSFAYSSQTKAYSRTFWDFMIGMPLTKKGQWVLGWNYSSYSFIDNPGTAETLTITDMGPKVVYYLNKDRTWVVSVTYNLITKGSYNGGSAVTELRGTSIRADFGYTPYMTDNLLMGAKLNYYKPTLSEEITNQTALAKTSNSRTVIYPSFAITYRFE